MISGLTVNRPIIIIIISGRTSSALKIVVASCSRPVFQLNTVAQYPKEKQQQNSQERKAHHLPTAFLTTSCTDPN